MEDETAPATPSMPDQSTDTTESPAVAAPIGSLEEATPTDKGVLETQESVPQSTKKAAPSRPPPSRPAGGSKGASNSNGGSKSSENRQPSVPSRRPPSKSASALTSMTISTSRFSTNQSEGEGTASAAATADFFLVVLVVLVVVLVVPRGGTPAEYRPDRKRTE